MPAQWRHLVNDEVQSSDDATFIEELPNDGALHALFVKVRCQNGATSGRGVTLLDVVDDLRIVTGANEQLFSLIPEELEKWYELMFGKPLEQIWTEVGSARQEMVFPILFGRNVYDPNIFLPLDRFREVNFEAPYSPTISDTVGFITGQTSFDLMALITPGNEALDYKGTLVTRRIKAFTSLASGEDDTELPPEATIRNVGIYAYEAGIEQNVDITRVQLRDTGRDRGYFDADWEDLVNIGYKGIVPKIRHAAHLFMSDADSWTTRLGNIEAYALTVHEDQSILNDEHIVLQADTIDGDRIVVDAARADLSAGFEDLTANVTDFDIFATAEGKGPGYFGIVPFSWQDDPAGYQNMADLSKPILRLTQGAAGADVRVSIQELRQF